MHLVLEIDDPDGTPPHRGQVGLISQSERVLRNRVDELGVEEPLIQKVGQDRLIVELAGVTDEERAKEIVGTTALLEFKLVRPLSDIEPYLGRIDRAIVHAGRGLPPGAGTRPDGAGERGRGPPLRGRGRGDTPTPRTDGAATRADPAADARPAAARTRPRIPAPT
jgi:hypothetical protein